LGTRHCYFLWIFVVVLLSFVFKSRTYDHSLVTEKYYEEDLNYQTFYEKRANTIAAKDPLIIGYQAELQNLNIQFPSHMQDAKGTILLFNPSAKTLDVKVPIQLNSDGFQKISTEDLKSGSWKIKVDWEHEERGYFQETTVYL